MNPGTHHDLKTKQASLQTRINLHLTDPAALEQIYRSDRSGFKNAFNGMYADIKENIIAQVWKERLNYASEEINRGSRIEWLFLSILILISGLILKIPDIIQIDKDFFYVRNISFATFPMIASYFLWKQRAGRKKIFFLLLAFLISVVYMNALPDASPSDTLILACIHMPIFLWIVVGYTFPAEADSVKERHISFLRFNGDLVVMGAVMGLAGFLFTAITVGLFKLIGIDISSLLSNFIAPWGLPAIPIVATYLVQNNPMLVSRISPLIARIFTPLIFVMLLLFLGSVIYTGKDPYNDREFLLLFNVLLIGVMAVILFSLSEAGKYSQNRIQTFILMGLALLAIIANGIALSAISFRISEYGITPNRLAVLGSNVLIFSNLVWVTWQLFRSTKENAPINSVEKVIASFLPVYGAWTAGMAFILPVLFHFQ